MKRKSIILLISILLLSFSSICFAADTGNDIKNAVNGATNTVVDGAHNLMEDVRQGVGTAENTIENTAQDVGNTVMNGANYIENAGDNMYTTTRSVAEDATTPINNNTATTWTWIIVTVAAIVIVSLVWYYASQHSRH